jgi:hypothetical protein
VEGCKTTPGSEGVQNSPPLEGWPPKADGVVDGKHEMPRLMSEPPTTPPFGHPSKGGELNHPPSTTVILSSPHKSTTEGETPSLPKTRRRPANPPKSSLRGVKRRSNPYGGQSTHRSNPTPTKKPSTTEAQRHRETRKRLPPFSVS